MAIRIRDKSAGAGVSMKDGNRAGNPAKGTEKKEQIPDVRSFREQAILAINILESQGIDLYDPTRTPGMYLKRRGTAKVPDALISKILTKEQGSEPTRNKPPAPAEHSKENRGEIPPGLFNFMKQKKNQ
jgi:hypothetical protein